MHTLIDIGDQNAKRRKLMVESDDDSMYSCDSDADQLGGKRSGKYEAGGAAKRQQGASKQKRMMGKELGAHPQQQHPPPDASSEEELPNKIVDLLVMGLPFELNEEELRVHFESFGKVVHCEVCHLLRSGC